MTAYTDTDRHAYRNTLHPDR